MPHAITGHGDNIFINMFTTRVRGKQPLLGIVMTKSSRFFNFFLLDIFIASVVNIFVNFKR